MANVSRTYKERSENYIERTRNKIAASSILPKLIRYAEGNESELNHSQALIATKLLGKLVPDLTSTSVDVSIDHDSLNVLELNARLSSLGYDSSHVWQQLNGQSVAIEHDPNTTDNVAEPVDKSDPNQDLIQTPPPPE